MPAPSQAPPRTHAASPLTRTSPTLPRRPGPCAGSRPPGWNGIRQATAFGSPCYGSTQTGAPSIPMSENCLTLNLWAQPSTGQSRPVMIYLHGGAPSPTRGPYPPTS
ncbi:carboxylesterase family protein [Streptomyces sp. NPDC048304]|uniref:carboxylesterase family protein n=1 Tax=Streptomyces sp. NPDC048304 TaxID=3154820 RepID=UPI00340DC654